MSVFEYWSGCVTRMLCKHGGSVLAGDTDPQHFCRACPADATWRPSLWCTPHSCFSEKDDALFQVCVHPGL